MERSFHSLEDCRRHLEEFSVPTDNNILGRWNGRLPERWQRVVEENVETVVQSRCWGKMKNVPVIATPGTNRRILLAKIKVLEVKM